MTVAVDISLLGYVAATGPLGQAELSGSRQRALVALLALSAGRVVPLNRLVDALWGEDPPRTAVRSLHSHLSRVRQAFSACGIPEVLLTREPGYLLAVSHDRVDVHRFEAAVRQGREALAANAPGRAAHVLRSGLKLWRGPALAGAELAGWAATEAQRLDELRICAMEDLGEARLRLGEHAAVLAELESLLVSHPSRERLTGLSMLALHRAGRSAAALDRYERLRVSLAEQLGADPGPWLQDLHGALLRGDASHPALTLGTAGRPDSAGPTPVQLPRRPGHFTGRRAELSILDDQLDSPTGPRIVVICGPAGMGKTALAVSWAQQIKDRFPDGQVFCELRGHDPEAALTPADALAHVLSGLGVPADRLPPAPDERAEAYATLMRGRRVLVVLDNAGTADHVLPLVPPTPESLIIVTSRNHLSGLLGQFLVQVLELDMLADGEASELFASVIGAQRVAAESEAVATLAGLCGYIPLALRIGAARLAARPRLSVAALAAELAGDARLDALQCADEPRSIRSVFMGAYQALSETAARLFGRIALHPGPTFIPHVAATLAGQSYGLVRRGLSELAAAHLISEVSVERYRFHDLIRLYAAERAQADEPGGDLAAARARLLDWYLAMADTANRNLDPSRDRVKPTLRHAPAELVLPDGANALLSYLDAERANVIAVAEYAAREGQHSHAWQVAYLMAGYFESRGYASDRVRLLQAGLVAARQSGEPMPEGLMESGLGVACIAARDYEQALAHLAQALEMMCQIGDRRGEGHAHNNIAVALMGQGRWHEAIAAGERALAVHTANDHSYGVILAANNLGDLYAVVGDTPRSLGHLQHGLTLAQREGNTRLESAIYHTIGEAYRLSGDSTSALAHFERSLALRRHAGIHHYVALTLIDIGNLHLSTSDAARGRDHFLEALEAGQSLGDEHLESLALARLGHTELCPEGDPARGRAYLDRALGLRSRVPDDTEEAHLLRDLGEMDFRAGRPTSASHHWDRAMLLYKRAGVRLEAEALAARIHQAGFLGTYSPQ